MGLADYLRTNNGLKTTQSVLNKQQSGVDAVHKASPEQINMNTAQAMLHGKEEQLTPPKDAHEQAVRMNQQTAEGMLNGSIPIVKKEETKPEPKQEPEKKQLTYAEMYKMLNPADSESPEQIAQREKNEKRKARIAALGDGLRALANIVFASKGAKVVHNPESDMTAAINKRKAYMDAQREKNRAAWQTGYQRALALDEEARKNNLTLAEQMRYHDNMDRVNRAKVMLDQMRIEQQDEYNKGKLSNQESANKETVRHHKEQESTSRKNANANVTRAQKAGKNKGGSSKENYNKTLAGLTTKDPNGVREVTRSLKRAGVPQNAQTIVEAYRAQKGSSSSNGRTLHGIK